MEQVHQLEAVLVDADAPTVQPLFQLVSAIHLGNALKQLGCVNLNKSVLPVFFLK